jgi:hypothetical protein
MSNNQYLVEIDTSMHTCQQCVDDEKKMKARRIELGSPFVRIDQYVS